MTEGDIERGRSPLQKANRDMVTAEDPEMDGSCGYDREEASLEMCMWRGMHRRIGQRELTNSRKR
jgi:hypothetical protein